MCRLTVPKITQISEDPKLRVDDSASLWRYIRLSTLFLNISGTVYVPTIAQLKKSDPKEGLAGVSPEWRVGYLCDHEPDIIEKIFEALPPVEQKQLGTADPSNLADIMQNSQIIADFHDEQQSQSKCAWCWHSSPHESAAMWKLYANSGVAIQTTLARIASALPNPVCFEGARVQYGNREPGQEDSFNPEAPGIRDILTRAYLFKNHDYEFENEVRLVIDAETPGSGRLINNLSADKMVQRIVFSPWIELDEFEALRRMSQPLCPNAEITRSPLIRDPNSEKTTRALNGLFSGSAK